MSKSIPFKEQKLIIKRMFTICKKPFKKTFFAGHFLCFFSYQSSTFSCLEFCRHSWITILHNSQQPIKSSISLRVSISWGSHQSSHLVFSMVSILDGFLADVSICADQLFEKLHSLGMRYFDQTPAGSIVSRSAMIPKHCMNSGMCF